MDVRLEGAEATAQEVRKNGRKTFALQVDVSDPAAVKAMVDRVVAELGRLDILVNSAGVREIVPFLQLPFAEWQRVIATNLTGTFLCSQAVAQYMVAQGKGGKIVNLASVAGLMAVPNRAAYVSSKHAVVGLTKEMAMELGEKNIQVNAVAPGMVQTAMTASYFGNTALVASLKKVHPAGRWAQPEEIAGWAAEVRAGSNGPFQLNLWIPDPAPKRDPDHEARVRDFLAAWGPTVPAEAGNAVPPV